MSPARIVLLNALFLAGCVSTAVRGASPTLPSSDGEGGAEAAVARSLGDHQQHRQPIGIVIMAQGRSGSTMLGETFRQNKDVLYWYEPCRSWGQGLFSSSSQYHREIHGEECADLVRRLARCEFTLEDSARLGVDPAALESGSPGLAPLREASDNPSASVLARAHDEVIGNCKRSRAVVVKTIRADAGVSDDGDPAGLLVIHLVRDPRAVVHSQIKTFNVAHKYRRYFHGPPQQEEGAAAGLEPSTNGTQARAEGGSLPWGGRERARALGRIICGVYRYQLDSSANLRDGSYLRVRYEDIASSAESTVKRMYEWSGLGPVPSRVALWVHENTQLPDCEEQVKDTTVPTGVASHRMTTEESTHTARGGGGDGSEDGAATAGTATTGGENFATENGAEEEVPATAARLDVAEAEVAAVAAAAVAARREMSIQTNDEAGGGGGPGQRRGGQQQPKRHNNCKEMTAKQAEWDRYGTRRHAAAMVGLWRTQFPGDEAEVVWEACASSGVLEEMGYTQ